MVAGGVDAVIHELVPVALALVAVMRAEHTNTRVRRMMKQCRFPSCDCCKLLPTGKKGSGVTDEIRSATIRRRA
jgi:hypothetical protein